MVRTYSVRMRIGLCLLFRLGGEALSFAMIVDLHAQFRLQGKKWVTGWDEESIRKHCQKYLPEALAIAMLAHPNYEPDGEFWKIY